MSYDVSAFYVTETHLKNRLKTDVKPGGGILSGGNGPGYQTNDRRPLGGVHAHAWHGRSFLADVFQTPAHVSALLRLTEWLSAGDDCHEGVRRARSPFVSRLWWSPPPHCVRPPYTCSS